MRVIVCGGRDFDDRATLFAKLARLHREWGPFTLVIHGDAHGADRLAGEWARTARVPTGLLAGKVARVPAARLDAGQARRGLPAFISLSPL